MQSPHRCDSGLNVLTPRETDVVRQLMRGKANKVIAHELGLTELTVKVYMSNMFEKVGVSNRLQLQLALWGLEHLAADAPVGDPRPA